MSEVRIIGVVSNQEAKTSLLFEEETETLFFSYYSKFNNIYFN
jgi:hypothetical protein